MSWTKQTKVSQEDTVSGWGDSQWGLDAWGGGSATSIAKQPKASDSWTKKTKAS